MKQWVHYNCEIPLMPKLNNNLKVWREAGCGLEIFNGKFLGAGGLVPAQWRQLVGVTILRMEAEGEGRHHSHLREVRLPALLHFCSSNKVEQCGFFKQCGFLTVWIF